MSNIYWFNSIWKKKKPKTDNNGVAQRINADSCVGELKVNEINVSSRLDGSSGLHDSICGILSFFIYGFAILKL